ncbi:MAG: hypothetical protein ACRDY7_14960 [Acidimicrobiia bacterium]
MNAVLDSSCLISLARAGLLHLLPAFPLEPVLLEIVWGEVVGAGRSGGHADAVAVEAALADQPRDPGRAASTPDAAVLAAATDTGVLVANDLALGRRARNLGVRWLRTADLVVLAVASGRLSRDEGRAAIIAMRDSGRVTTELAAAYLEELT